MDKRLERRSLLGWVLGIALLILGLFFLIRLYTAGPVGGGTSWLVWLVWPAVGISLIMILAGFIYHLKARARHWAWVFLLLLGAVGFIILMWMPDREIEKRNRGEELLEIDDDKPGT
jgi:hypothetical protein